LALRKVADVAQIADSRGNLQTALGGTRGRLRDESDSGFCFGLLRQQGLLAAAANV